MKKVSILFGAGAAIPWEAPFTNDITQAINDDNQITIDGKSLGVWINESIKATSTYLPLNINFETYVDFLESIYSYLTETDDKTNSQAKSQLSSIFEIKPDIIEGIKKIKFDNNSSFNSDTDKIRYCFYSFIRIIGNSIFKYLKNYEKTDLEINQKLRFFLEHFIKIGYCVRSYSLNYDRSIPLVFESVNSEYKIFDGFDIKEHNAGKKDLFFCNKEKILNDSLSNSFYNLHGSFHWTFQDCDYKTTNGTFPFVLMSSAKNIYYPPAHVEDYPIDSNPNEQLLQSPIITGFKKIQRVNQEPFNYFFHNFFRDLHQSEIIIIVGYSFSDPHINQLLKDALRRRVRIYNIAKRTLSAVSPNLLTNWGLSLRNDFPEQTDWFRDVEFFYSEYTKGFKEFLLTEQWYNIQPM